MKKASLKTRMGSMIIISIMLMLLLASITYGFACFCDGYVFNHDTTDADAGVNVNVTNLNTGEVDETNTSYDFPPFPQFENRYKTAFGCMEGIDPIKVYADNGTHSASFVQVVPLSSQAYANLTLKPKTIQLSITPLYRFAQPGDDNNYTVTVKNIASETKNFTMSTVSPITANLNLTNILNLPAGNTVDVLLTTNSAAGGYFSTAVYGASTEEPDINDSMMVVTEVNHTPIVSNPSDTPDPVDNNSIIRFSATVTDPAGIADTSKILVCTNNTAPVDGQCGINSVSLCDYGDATVTASTTGATVTCYHNATEGTGNRTYYYIGAADKWNTTAAFTARQSYLVGPVLTVTPPSGGGGGAPPPEEEEPEETCSDGIRNQDETGTDCGGSCAPCPPTCSDGIWNQGELSVDCGGPCDPCETCYDGIQNQDETGTDCGGVCKACETCSDGIQNQDETGTDCGGVCEACPSCSDGILNQDEEQIDCGGVCLPCPPPESCYDEIQNQEETGVDCGGPCQECELPPELEEPERPEDLTRDVQTKSIIDCEEKVTVTTKVVEDIYTYSVYGLDETSVSTPIQIPKDYVMLTEPFSTDCAEDTQKLTISVPDDMEDIKVLRCRGENCRVTKAEQTEELCPSEAKKLEKKKFDYTGLKVDNVELNITKTRRKIEKDDYTVQFDDTAEGLEVQVSQPEEEVDYPANENVKIVGVPIAIHAKTNKTGNLGTTNILVPYKLEPGDDEDSIALYAQKNVNGTPRWTYIGGNIDITTKTISATVNISEITETGRIIVAPITISCEDCTISGFTNVFTPEPDTRDAIILAHGLFGTEQVWQGFIRNAKLTNQPNQIWTYSYLVSKPVEDNAIAMANYLEANNFRYDKISMVGYSLGGLVTEEALRYAYDENQKNPNRYKFIKKVDKALLIATPNEGSPVAEQIERFLTEYINEAAADLIPINPITKAILQSGKQIEPVPTIDYYAIAGTKPYGFLRKTGMLEELFGDMRNDGLVSTESAIQIGTRKLDQECTNFWTRERDHTHLITDQNTQKLILQILNSNIAEALDEQKITGKIAGYTNYYDIEIDSCSEEDTYIVIGKPMPEEDISRDLICACGDGVCSGFETANNCPSDCKRLSAKSWASIILLVLLISLAIYINAKDYLLEFIRIVLRGIKHNKSDAEIKKEILDYGFYPETLTLIPKVKKLKSMTDYKIRDLLAEHMSKKHKKKFLGVFVIKNWIAKLFRSKAKKEELLLKTTKSKKKKEEQVEEKEEPEKPEEKEEKKDVEATENNVEEKEAADKEVTGPKDQTEKKEEEAKEESKEESKTEETDVEQPEKPKLKEKVAKAARKVTRTETVDDLMEQLKKVDEEIEKHK